MENIETITSAMHLKIFSIAKIQIKILNRIDIVNHNCDTL